MATFMKGDTALEVASALARTDPNNHQSMQDAIEVVKIYVRAKIKKTKGSKAVGAPGGKLEALEKKYAHLGYQDIFYLVRMSFGLPPSAIDIPRPSSPVRRQLMKGKFPLPLEYQLPLGGDDGTSSIITVNSGSTGLTSARDSPVTPSSERPRGRDLSVKSLSRGPSVSTVHRMPSGLGVGPSTLSVSSISPVSPAPPSPASNPIPISSSHRDSEIEDRDFFDQSTRGSPPARSPRSFATASVAEPIRPRAESNATVMTARSNHTTESVYASPAIPESPSMQSTSSATRAEDDVRRMLEARIKALQTALRDLDVSEIPASMMSATTSPVLARQPSDASSSYSARAPRQAAPSHPPPNLPLPPLPAPDLGQPFSLSSSFRPTPPNIRTTTLRKQSGLQLTSTPPQRSPETPHSPELVFDLDPELALDPFAPITGAAATAAATQQVQDRTTREMQAYVRSERDLRRVKLENNSGRWTPPPKYEYEESAPSPGRAL